MDKIAEFLIEKETITGKEFMEIFHRVTGKKDSEGKNDGDRVSLQKEEGRAAGSTADGTKSSAAVPEENGKDKVQLAKEELPWKQDV